VLSSPPEEEEVVVRPDPPVLAPEVVTGSSPLDAVPPPGPVGSSPLLPGPLLGGVEVSVDRPGST
jgi:hypothetical protein